MPVLEGGGAIFLIEISLYLTSLARDIFTDNLLVRVHLIIEIILVDRSCAMGI